MAKPIGSPSAGTGSTSSSTTAPSSSKQFVKKKVDSRIRTLVENGVATGHRSMFAIVGDKGKDLVMYLHYMLAKARVAQKPSVLWCYKKELGFSSHRKKRIKHHQNMVKRGLKDADTEDPFELFIAGTNIRYCYYKETEKVLGQTFGMLVLQDFEALTPNLLARTIETVEGGGLVIFLMRTMKSLRQLYTMTMDVHARYRTEAHHDVVARFNERFILSLGDCANCMVVDDELNILPISKTRGIKPVVKEEGGVGIAEPKSVVELKELKESLKDTQPVSALVNQARTLDQAKAVLTFVEAISEKTLRSTVTLTAARGRGKSAALGIAMASAIAYGYSNIFVTSPTPENLKTLFEFVFKAFDALGYEEHMDYTIVQSTNPDFNKAIVRVNVFRDHRQTIQYIQPQDAHVLGQAELVVIDEAAAIPLPLVKKLMGPYLVFMASTINGYEGTGRSLSLKLIQQLREQSAGLNTAAAASANADGKAVGGRTLREVKLEEPIRYMQNDPAEAWLNKLLCLDASVMPRAALGCPHPSECELYAVNRDTLFSFHPLSEVFLQRMMALYVASHYKNTPNDLQLMSDAPAHQLFVLLPPVRDEDTALPEPLAVVQVCLEGEISRQSLMASLTRGKRADGDLIPWTVSQQFQDDDFASLSGARVVRIATHPDYTRMGYGSRALDLLVQFYEGKIPSMVEDDVDVDAAADHDRQAENVADEGDSSLLTEVLRVRDPSKMPPLLASLSETTPPTLHWIGVSYGLTPDLFRFWKRAHFSPVYLRQTTNDLTGEHTCIMMRTVQSSSLHCDPGWLASFALDFKKRFLQLLSFQFKEFAPALSLGVLDIKLADGKQVNALTQDELLRCFSGYDLKRLESYANNMLDYHVIMDLLPIIAQQFFTGRLSAGNSSTPMEQNIDADMNEAATTVADSVVQLSAVQKAILLGMGLQHKSVDQISTELGVPVSQLLALFIRAMRKVSAFYKKVNTDAAERTIEPLIKKSSDGVVASTTGSTLKRQLDDDEAWDPTAQTLADDLDDGAVEANAALRERQRALISSLDLTQYAIAGGDDEWSSALTAKQMAKQSAVVSIKNPASTKLGKAKLHGTTVEEVAAEGRKLAEKAGKKSKKPKRK